MGRIVKGAKFAKNPYVVSVPANFSDGAATNGTSNGHAALEPIDFEPVALDLPPSEPEVARVDWGAVRHEAAKLIDQAYTNSEELISEAQQRAVELISDAAAHAQEIEDAARKTGFDSGQADGQAAAGAELEEMLVTMRGLVDVARAERHKIIEGVEPEIIRLAMMLAEKIVHQEIALDKTVVVSMAKAAIARLVNRESVTVRVNPADIETIREHRDRMLASTDLEHLRLVEDQRVDRGGVVMETESGTIDAKVATQIREARRALAVEDEPVPVAPSGDESLLTPPAQAS